MLPTPHFIDDGAGPGVVCLHSNASHGNQWRALMQTLTPEYRVLAPDLYGAGRSPVWRAQRHLRLADEVDFLEPVFRRAGDPFLLVGHSYGAAVALIAALTFPGRIAGLVLYEPTLFALVDAATPPPNRADGIRHVVEQAGLALEQGDSDRAAACFIDFWMGDGAWAQTPDARKAAIAASMQPVRRWGHALFNEPTRLAAFKSLDVPVLYLTGGRSPAPSRAVADVLVPVLPDVVHATFDDAGHMGPITHPARVNAAIARFVHAVLGERTGEQASEACV